MDVIRTYWLLFAAIVVLAAAADLRSPGLAVLAVGAAFVWWDSTEADQ